MNALQYMGSALFFRDVFARTKRVFQLLSRRLRRRRAELLPTAYSEKASPVEQENEAIREYNDHTALIFTLNLSFMLAGLAQFITLLAYANVNTWDTACGTSSTCCMCVFIIDIAPSQLSSLPGAAWPLKSPGCLA